MARKGWLMSSGVGSSESGAARDFDGLYKALLEAYPRDALHLLCGARLDGSAVVVVVDGPTEQLVQIEPGMLVGGSLAVQVVEASRSRGMSDVLEQTESGREIARRNREQGLEQGLERGLEQGRVDGMRALLRARFGDFADLDDLARRLADRDHDGNIARIVAGATLAELRS
jgi:hypothetical protein